MITLTLIISLFSCVLVAPPVQTICIDKPEPIRVFDSMLNAFQKVESNYRTDVVNHLGYTGILQEGAEMIAEANRICTMYGKPAIYTFPASALDSTQSVQIWYIVQNFWNPKYELRRACHIWNPLANNKYYSRIKSNL